MQGRVGKNPIARKWVLKSHCADNLCQTILNGFLLKLIHGWDVQMTLRKGTYYQTDSQDARLLHMLHIQPCEQPMGCKSCLSLLVRAYTLNIEKT